MLGIDIEQFTRDPYGSGIQRVLQYLALNWPHDVAAHFLAADPDRDGVLIQLSPVQAGELLSIPFLAPVPERDTRDQVMLYLRDCADQRIAADNVIDCYGEWLLPEVSYLPSVLERFESVRTSMRTTMIGYDALPMTEPANYRFRPGLSAWVSEYFRLLALVDSVACISSYSRDVILSRLRRNSEKITVVAHPGGDHIPMRVGNPPPMLTFCRVGTMEPRKRPVEILRGFTNAVDDGLEAHLIFVGGRSPSHEGINGKLEEVISAGYPVTWVESASDSEVMDIINHSSVFLSIGIEGYGIPVLEAIRLGTPVIYNGIQPAAALMEGQGTRRVVVEDDASLAPIFMSARDQLPALRQQVNGQAVPTWREFSRVVAYTAAR